MQRRLIRKVRRSYLPCLLLLPVKQIQFSLVAMAYQFNLNIQQHHIVLQQRPNLSNLMYNHRQNIDLEFMIDKNSALSRPRPPTPIRKVPVRAPSNKENLINPGNQWGTGGLKINTNFDDKELLMPDHNVKKPLISPVRNPFKTQIDSLYEQEKKGSRIVPKQMQQISQSNCANHPNKPAQFNIDIQYECFSYCSRCAAQLASQGFQVRKIQTQSIKKPNSISNQTPSSDHQLPIYPQYQGNPMYQLILQFLTQLSQVQNQHLHNMTKLTTIDSNYTQQIENTKYFYSELVTFIQQMRDDHINDLVEESRRHSQIADIQHDYLRENVDEIGNIRRDIEENLETIVEKLEEEDLRNNLNYYKQKLQVYRHKVEEQADFFTKLINFAPEEYQNKLGRVQDFLMEVWSSDSQSPTINQQQEVSERFAQKFMQPQQPTRQLSGPQKQTFKQNHNQYQYQQPQSQQSQPQPYHYQPQQPRNQPQPQPLQQPAMMPNLSKKNSNQAQEAEAKSTAFRKLFEEDEDQAMAETSPQFKKI